VATPKRCAARLWGSIEREYSELRGNSALPIRLTIPKPTTAILRHWAATRNSSIQTATCLAARAFSSGSIFDEIAFARSTL